MRSSGLTANIRSDANHQKHHANTREKCFTVIFMLPTTSNTQAKIHSQSRKVYSAPRDNFSPGLIQYKPRNLLLVEKIRNRLRIFPRTNFSNGDQDRLPQTSSGIRESMHIPSNSVSMHSRPCCLLPQLHQRKANAATARVPPPP